ncbi:DUF4097 domain-containing protein [Colwelliaceae bacterium 6471]
MNIINTLMGITFASIAMASWAGERVNETLSAEGVTNINIENLRGQIAIIGWDKNEVALEGELDEQSKQLIFEKSGNRINVKVVVPRHLGNGKNRDGSDLTVNIPKHLSVDFSGVSTDVTLSNLLGSTEIKSVSGNINANKLQHRIELGTVSGNITSNNLSGKISLSSVSGNIEDKHSNGEVKLKVVSGNIYSQSNATEVVANNISGNIELELAAVDDFSVTTVSGDLNANLSLNDSGVAKLSSVSGDIDIEFQKDIQASFRMHANAGGDLINRLTNDQAARAKYGPSSKLSFQVGNGSATVRANTVSGEIKFSYQ